MGEGGGAPIWHRPLVLRRERKKRQKIFRMKKKKDDVWAKKGGRGERGGKGLGKGRGEAVAAVAATTGR